MSFPYAVWAVLILLFLRWYYSRWCCQDREIRWWLLPAVRYVDADVQCFLSWGQLDEDLFLFTLTTQKRFVSLVTHVYTDRLKSSDICGWGRLGDRRTDIWKRGSRRLWSVQQSISPGMKRVLWVYLLSQNRMRTYSKVCHYLYFGCCHVVLCLFRSRNKEFVTFRLHSAKGPRTRCPFSLKLPIPWWPRMPSIYGDHTVCFIFQTLISVDTRVWNGSSVYFKQCLYIYQSVHSGKKNIIKKMCTNEQGNRFNIYCLKE